MPVPLLLMRRSLDLELRHPDGFISAFSTYCGIRCLETLVQSLFQLGVIENRLFDEANKQIW